MLYRFREAMLIEAGVKWNPNSGERLAPASCDSLPIAFAARKNLLKEISRKIGRIQDPSLAEELVIRQLNDEINQMIREKNKWDARILELGGGAEVERRRKDLRWGDEMLPEPGNTHGYLYFGRAKELPGVREILNPRKEERTKLPPRVQQIQRLADAAYYGHTDADEEQQALEREIGAERALLQRGTCTDWITGLPQNLPIPPEGKIYDELVVERMSVPTQSEVEAHLVERHKKELINRFV